MDEEDCKLSLSVTWKQLLEQILVVSFLELVQMWLRLPHKNC